MLSSSSDRFASDEVGSSDMLPGHRLLEEFIPCIPELRLKGIILGSLHECMLEA